MMLRELGNDVSSRAPDIFFRPLPSFFGVHHQLMLRKDQAVAENKSITKKDIRIVEQFLQTPVAEELFSNLLEYLHSGSGESPEGLASKMQGAELADLVKRMAEKPLAESQQGIALASSYRQVLLRGSNIRVLSRERAFFELLYHYANILGYVLFPRTTNPNPYTNQNPNHTPQTRRHASFLDPRP